MTDETLREAADRIRVMREAASKATFRRGLLAVVVVLSVTLSLVLALFLGWRLAESRLQLLVIAGVIALATVAFWVLLPGRRQSMVEKSVLVPLVLEDLGDLEYMPTGRISEEILAASRMFRRWNDYTGGDLVRGRRGEVVFGYARAALTRGGPGRIEALVTSGRVHDVFRGAVLAIEGAAVGDSPAVAATRREATADWLAEMLAERPGLHRRAVGALDIHAADRRDGEWLAGVAAPVERLREAAGAEWVEIAIEDSRILMKFATRRPVFPGYAPDPVDELDDFRREVAALLDLVRAVAA